MMDGNYRQQKPTSNPYLSASKVEFLEPSPISKPNRSFCYELYPSLKAMVWENPSQGLITKILAITCESSMKCVCA